MGRDVDVIRVRAPTLIRTESLEAILEAGGEGVPADLLFTATREVTKLLGERGSCILFDDSPRVVVAPHSPAVAGRPVSLERYPEVMAAREGRELVAIEDVRKDRLLETVRTLLPTSLRAVAAVPLLHGKRSFGAFLVQSSRPRQVSRRARAASVLVGRFTAAFLARAETSGQSVAMPPPCPHHEGAAIARPGDGRATRRILVVEDNEAISLALATLLEDEGYAVERAATGQDGLRHALAARPDLILLDVNLPFVDGFETATRLRHAPNMGDVPIVFLSGRRDLPARMRALHIDNCDFIPKPYRVDELLARIERAFAGTEARQILQLHADHDELTGLGNLRLFRARMADEHARFARYGSPLSLVMMDVDKLKIINDEHGHVVGSQVLRAIAEVLKRAARVTDLAARYGGDEFVVLLAHTTLSEAAAFAHRVLDQIGRINLNGVRVTVSVGVAALDHPERLDSAEQLLQRADAAAYLAKRTGGNQIRLEGEPAR